MVEAGRVGDFGQRRPVILASSAVAPRQCTACASLGKFGNIVKIGSNLAKWFDEPFVAYARR
jgi:hypothetical protein